jgi:glycosyltransferase involved in cell wall biosynthesis
MEIVINGRFLTQPITGVQRYARELVEALDGLLDGRREFRIAVVSPRLSNSPPVWRNIPVHQVGRFQGHLWEQIDLPQYSRGKVLFCPGNTAPIISLVGGQPVIVTVHDLSYMYFPDAYRPLFRLWYRILVPLALRRARAIITVSDSERRAIIEHFPNSAQRIFSVPNGGLPDVLLDQVARGSPASERDCILYVGSFSKRKNFPRILDVACRLARKRSLRFVLIGGTSTTLAASVADIPRDLSDKITIVDAVSDFPTLISYYRRASCFLFPSLYESSGLPPLEAMSCGCPVVVSDIPALRERCGDAALYCDPHDVSSIMAAVETIIDEPAVSAHLAEQGRTRAATFSWVRCANQTLDVIASFL